MHKNDIGTKFLLTIKEGAVVVDISTANVKSIIYQKPSRAIATQTAAFETDGSDGLIYYTTQANDLDEVGEWRVQAEVTMSGSTWRSSIEEFQVHENLE